MSVSATIAILLLWHTALQKNSVNFRLNSRLQNKQIPLHRPTYKRIRWIHVWYWRRFSLCYFLCPVSILINRCLAFHRRNIKTVYRAIAPKINGCWCLYSYGFGPSCCRRCTTINCACCFDASHANKIVSRIDRKSSFKAVQVLKFKILMYTSVSLANAKTVSQKDVGIRLEESENVPALNRIKRQANELGLNYLRSDNQYTGHEKPEHLPTPAESKKLYKAGYVLFISISFFNIELILISFLKEKNSWPNNNFVHHLGHHLACHRHLRSRGSLLLFLPVMANCNRPLLNIDQY